MRKIENMMLTVFLVVSLICGKFLLDYWQDSYDNRQNYRQVEEIAFPEKDTQEEETEPNEDNSTTEIDDFDYQSLLDENADCIGCRHRGKMRERYRLYRGGQFWRCLQAASIPCRLL